MKSAKTRFWEPAEKLAQVERDLRNPAKCKERELEARERDIEAKAPPAKAKNITVQDPTERWLKSRKSGSK